MRFLKSITKEKLKLWLKKLVWLFLNPRLLLCLLIAWMITNGWSYVLLGVGLLTNVHWITAVATAYLAFLWLPISPEKIVTFAIGLFLVRRLFPKHNQALKEQIEAATQKGAPTQPKV